MCSAAGKPGMQGSPSQTWDAEPLLSAVPISLQAGPALLSRFPLEQGSGKINSLHSPCFSLTTSYCPAGPTCSESFEELSLTHAQL